MKKQEIENVLEAGKAACVQRNQMQQLQDQMFCAKKTVEALSQQGSIQDTALQSIQHQLASLEELQNNFDDMLFDEELWEDNTQRVFKPQHPYHGMQITAQIPLTQVVPVLEKDSWETYLGSVQWYAHLEHIDLSIDPYVNLLSRTEQAAFIQQVREDYYEQKPQCDIMDYALAAFCGTVGGLVDIFLVGDPSNSILGNWTDKKVDQVVEKISKQLWNNDQPLREKIRRELKGDDCKEALKKAGIPYDQFLTKAPENIQQCIQYLEKKFAVNYDATSLAYLASESVEKLTQAQKDALEHMTPKNHHFFSLAHMPDLVGLIFSILDQFTGKVSFLAEGQFIRVVPVPKTNQIDAFELRGSNFIAKLFCGFVNWLGHCLSDLAGSGTTRSDPEKRGMGLPLPGFELFQGLALVAGKNDGFGGKLAELSVKVFESGYDTRFGIAMAIPVALSTLLTRLCFALKRYFYHGLPLEQSIPIETKRLRQPELRRMLLVSHGTLCAWDTGDALIRSGGQLLAGALRLNYWAYARLAMDGLAEVRAKYRQNYIDLQSITKSTQMEWQALYQDTSFWKAWGLTELEMSDNRN